MPLAWFTQSSSRYAPMILELMAAAIVIRLLGLVEPFVFQAIIDRVLPFQREATLALIVVVMVLVMLTSSTLHVLSGYLANHMSNRLIAELAARIFRHVIGLPLRYLQHWPVGETLARIGEIGTVKTFLTGTIAGYVLDVVFAGTYIVALLSISPFLTVIVLAILPLQLIAFGIIGPFSRRRMQTSFYAGARHQSRLVETFGNMVTVKALASEARQVERLRETLADSLSAGFRVTKLNLVNDWLGDILGNSTDILVIFFGATLVFANDITLGEMVAFHLLSGKVSGPIISLSAIWEDWQSIRIARLRLGDFLNQAVESDDDKPALRIDQPLNLSLKSVSFGYDPERPIINRLTVQITPNRPTIIIGDSGAGKSTLAKLMSGLYMPDRGAIEANGQDLKDCDPCSVRRTIAYLPQEPVLFSGTVLDNLLLAKPDATEEQIQYALRDSGADQVVAQLPNGMQTDVGEHGSHISGGQRQRVALARAILSDASALILDEPTSALDARSAEVIVTALKRLSHHRTLIVITHNPDLLGANVNILNLTDLQKSDVTRQPVWADSP